MSKVLPEKYEEVKNKLEDMVCTIEYKEEMNNPLAYTCRNIGSRLGHSYKIVCSNDYEEITPYLLTHEGGHVILNHCKDLQLSDLIVKNMIKACWKKISPYFEKFNEDNVFDYFESYLYNVSMDWEVNSKFLSLKEIEYMEKIINEKNNKEGNEERVEFLYPTRNNYPEKKSWLEYLTFIVMNPEEFFNNMRKNNNEENGEEQEGNGKSSGGKGTKKNKKEGNGNSKPSFNDLPEEVKQQVIDDFFKDIKKAYENEEKKDEASRKDSSNEVEENKLNNGKEGQNTIEDAPSMSNKGSKTSEEVLEFYQDETLEELLKKCLKSNVRRTTSNDIVYYYNRRKYGTNVLYTKKRSKKHTKFNNSMCVLLDVSGSVSSEKIQHFINTFDKVSRTLNKNCDLILWNTNFVQKFNTRDDKRTIRIGGGTDMAAGLDYISKDPKYNNSSVIVVSDFEDNLQNWKFNRKIYGICWNPSMVNYLNSSPDFKDFLSKFHKIFIK